MRKGLPDRTPAQTVTIVTKGWRRCYNEETGGGQTSRAVSKHWFPGFFDSTVTGRFYSDISPNGVLGSRHGITGFSTRAET
jgi:hypothetical protein